MRFAFMFIVPSLWLATVYGSSTCRVPDVYEFCSALTNANGHATGQLQNQKIYQGKPGKQGEVGRRGPQGEKGNQGEPGTCKHLEDRISSLEAKLRTKFDLIPKLVYCGMGMKNGEIQDSAITASSQQDHRFAPYMGRLDERITRAPTSSNVGSVGAWCPSSNEGQWIQVDLGTPKSVSGIVTQGRPPNQWGFECWVKTYKISCGTTTENMKFVSDNGAGKIFTGNTDMVTKVINIFPEPLTCRYVLLYVLKWNTASSWNRPCLRMEILKGECHDLF